MIAMPKRPDAVTFEAYVPEAGSFVTVDRERCKVTLYCSHEAGAVLTARAGQLADRVLVVTVASEQA